ncbi:PEGA domain-containing protein [Hyalangium rubrum]|uniref:PEGA domain-containing protein n=1 Tax=Hyalangium rubrum TaxID=3103134 RepID=A0ABU5GWM0_9BACT|nr:PEGA domain-containing protein [Hyalangium sp. s54d21]MDY7225491.1 PEGA domain-containing protein [Hyalangium sp. s54d21]
MKALVLALLPAVALAAPPPTPRRVSALLIPMDQGAESNSVKFETYMNEALEQFSGFTVRKPEELFGMPADDEAEASLKRGSKGLEESLAAYEAREYEDAERKLRATLKELHQAIGAMRSCADLCEATALYAAVLHQRGDIEEAKLNLIDLMALNPTFELNPKRYNKDFISLRAQVATSRSAALRGSAVVKSRPAGARVYVDGEFQGYTPVTVSTMQVGNHMLRLDRPGFRQHGQLLEVTPDDVEVNAELTPTNNYKKYDSQLDKVATEIIKTTPSQAAVAMGKSLSIDRGLVGTVKDLGPNGTEVVVGFFDLRNGKKIASRRVVLQGDEYGQEKAEMVRLVNYLVNNGMGGGEQKVKSSDPLDNRHGMEDWNGEDQGGRRRVTEKRKKDGDPLDTVNGTEEW